MFLVLRHKEEQRVLDGAYGRGYNNSMCIFFCRPEEGGSYDVQPHIRTERGAPEGRVWIGYFEKHFKVLRLRGEEC